MSDNNRTHESSSPFLSVQDVRFLNKKLVRLCRGFERSQIGAKDKNAINYDNQVSSSFNVKSSQIAKKLNVLLTGEEKHLELEELIQIRFHAIY